MNKRKIRMKLSKEDARFQVASWETQARTNLAWAIQTTEDLRGIRNRDLKNIEIGAV
jgi:hypothetical protein